MKKSLIIILISISVIASAQITAPGSSATTTTNYISATPNDSVYIFCYAGGVSNAELHASSPGGTSPFDFDWYKWDDNTSSFSIPVDFQSGIMTSQISNLDEGGYRVDISDGLGYNTSFVAWVHLDKPYAEIGLQKSLCYELLLRGKAEADTFNYFDTGNGLELLLPNDVRPRWNSSPSSPNLPSEISSAFYEGYIYKSIFPLPLDDLSYNLTVTDDYGCVNDSSLFYESIHVLADFSVDPESGEAPLEVSFTNNSIRDYSSIWNFGDDTISYLTDPGVHTFYRPGIYNVNLLIESDGFCQDSVSKVITVEPSALDIPNVFTPDGDGENEVFYVDNHSLRTIFVQIFSRGGKRVYLFEGEGERLREWQGWDGNIGGSKASSGIYYYIIRARGWDDITYEGQEYRGFLYLYR